MKKVLFLTILLVSLPMISKAQLEKGGKLVGGFASFSSAKQNFSQAPSITFITIQSTIQFLVTDNFSLGGVVQYQSASVQGFSQSVRAIGPMARYYFGNSSFYSQMAFLFNNETQTGSGDFSYTSIDLAVGYAAFLTDHVAIEPQLFHVRSNTNNSAANLKEIGFRLGFQIYLD